MRAGVWQGIGTIRCADVPEPACGDDQVLVRVGFCGFCGTDPHIIEGKFPVGDPPQVIGHEVAGEIVAVGSGVRGLEPGDRVGCNLFAYCGACAWCRAGQPNHCRRKTISAQGFAELAVYRPEQLFVLPDHISLQQAAFLEPLATCVHAIDTSRLRSGENVLVIGAGPLGLIIAQLAQAAGAATVVVSEPRAANRALAVALGATAAFDPSANDLTEVARGISDRRGFDVVFEVAGTTAALVQAPALACARGRIVIVGVHDPEATVPISPYLLFAKELSIFGVVGENRTFPRALALLDRLALDPLVTAIEPLEAIERVYAGHKAGDYVKVLVRP